MKIKNKKFLINFITGVIVIIVILTTFIWTI
jgi:hypothetical protein